MRFGVHPSPMVAVLAVSFVAAPCPAEHHARDPYVLEGIVNSVQWQTAAVRIALQVVDGAGGYWNWSVVGGTPASLRSLGWSSDSIKSGDKIDIVALPDNDTEHRATLVRVILPDGRALEGSARSHEIPTVPIYAAQHIEQRATHDPAAGYYRNTVTCQGATWECHVWISADHRLLLFSRDQQPDGSYALRGLEGTWWLQQVQGVNFMCFVFEGRRIPPICHSKVNNESVGDSWESVLPNGNHETKMLIAGRH